MGPKPLIEVLLASQEAYEDLVAEVYVDGVWIATLFRGTPDDGVRVQLSDPELEDSEARKNLGFEVLLEALEKGRRALLDSRVG